MFAASPANAQRVSSDILGAVTDTSGGAIVGASVTATHVETALTRSAETDGVGRYLLAGLEPGTYDLAAERAGLAPAMMRGLTVQVNQQLVVDLVLEIPGATARIEVVGRAPLLDVSTSHLSRVVTGLALHELPLNGRDVFQLTLLQSGVVPTTTAGPNPFGEGGLAKAAAQGARPTMNNLTLDGADINDPAYNLPPGGVSGTLLGVEGVAEFRVLLNGYGAEFGRNAGAHVQLVTRSGTNAFHGSLFEYHRNDALDARNYFDIGEKPPFTRNQFGGSIGGPIRRNRTFFFGTYEGLRERKSITSSFSVPDDWARAGLLPSGAASGGLVDVGVDPRVASLLAQFPTANGPPIGGGLATHRTSALQPLRGDYGLIRVDHALPGGDQMFGRYVIEDSGATTPFLSTFVPGFPGRRAGRNQYAMFGWTDVLGPNALNELKISVSRQRYLAEPANNHGLSISLLPDRPLGSIDIAGLPAIGNNLVYPVSNASNTFEFINNLSLHRAGHILKLGVNAKLLQIDGYFDLFANGQYRFADLSVFGLPAESANPALEFFLRAVPLVYIGVDPEHADSYREFRQRYLAGYVQDDWRVARRLSVNLGLRWEYWSNPSETSNRLSNIRNLETDRSPTVGKLFGSVPSNLWSPRVGFAWTPTARTVVRGAAGIMRDQIWANLYGNTRFYEPFYRPQLFILPQFRLQPPSVASLIGAGGPPVVINGFGIDYRPEFPYYAQYNLGVQRELPREFVLELAYAGSRGHNLLRSGEANPFDPTLGRPRNGHFGSLLAIATDGESTYDSAQASLQKRLSGGVMLQASYTLSKSTDDQSGALVADFVSEPGVAQDFFDRTGDRGRSAFDRRHALVLSFLYEVPFTGSGANPFLRALLSGWGIGGVLTMLSGPPFTATLGSFGNSGNMSALPADRPDLKPNVSPCDAVLGKPEQWFDPSIFKLPPPGRYGDAGRNIMCGPDLENVDLLLTRRLNVARAWRMQLRLEAFNLLNRANFDAPVNTQGPNGSGGNGDAVFVGRRAGCDPQADELGCGIPSPNAGRIFRTVTSARQVQLGLRLSF